MAKSANPGELRTAVVFKKVGRSQDADGFPVDIERAIFGQDADGKDIPSMGKWVSVHGTEVFTAMQLELKEAATFTTRYSPKYQIQLIAYKAGEADPYEVISIDDVEDRHRWVEIKLGRREGAR